MKIKKLQDIEGNWYWIPESFIPNFEGVVEKLQGVDYMDASDEYDLFNDVFEKYRTGGSPDLMPDMFNQNGVTIEFVK